MKVGRFQIPEEIVDAFEKGIWPRNHDEAIRQNLEPLVSQQVVREFAPEKDQLFLYPPPFETLRSYVESEENALTPPRQPGNPRPHSQDGA